MTEATLEKKTTQSPKWQTLFDTEWDMKKLEPLIQALEKQGVRREEWGMFRLIDETRDAWSVMYDTEKDTILIELSYAPDKGLFRLYKSGQGYEVIPGKETALERFAEELKGIYGGAEK